MTQAMLELDNVVAGYGPTTVLDGLTVRVHASERLAIVGRNLTDDVVNMGIALLSNGAAPHDGLRPHADLRSDFPFLGMPH